MSRGNERRTLDGRPSSAVSAAYVENNTFLKRFLARFFSDRQDIEDVAQEAYLRAFVAEQQKDRAAPATSTASTMAVSGGLGMWGSRYGLTTSTISE